METPRLRAHGHARVQDPHRAHEQAAGCSALRNGQTLLLCMRRVRRIAPCTKSLEKMAIMEQSIFTVTPRERHQPPPEGKECTFCMMLSKPI